MADENGKMQQQLGEIGLRYLKRTLTEIGGLRDLLAKLRSGETARLKEIEHLSHKIHGSGAMFGFDHLSSQAREIEIAAGTEADSPDLHSKLELYISGLENAAAAAAKARGLQ
jgi:HPt (histidine-containing phosphotransfer) domain-containing protein